MLLNLADILNGVIGLQLNRGNGVTETGCILNWVGGLKSKAVESLKLVVILNWVKGLQLDRGSAVTKTGRHPEMG